MCLVKFMLWLKVESVPLHIEKSRKIPIFSSLPDIDFNEIQTVLEYSEESGFKFPDKK